MKTLTTYGGALAAAAFVAFLIAQLTPDDDVDPNPPSAYYPY